MKYPQFIYSFLLLLVFGGCCKLDDSPILLRDSDKQLLANNVGDTLRFRDISNDSLHIFIVDSVETTLENSFGGFSVTDEKSGCGEVIRFLEVAKVAYRFNKGGYQFARRNNVLDFTSVFVSPDSVGVRVIIPDQNSERNFIKFHETLTVRGKTYRQVYELFTGNPSNADKFIRILIDQENGLVYMEDKNDLNRIFIRE